MEKDLSKQIDELKDLILSLKVDSPKLSRKEARKFLKCGDDKFKVYLLTGRIKKRYDDFKHEYYLRHELLQLLENNKPILPKRVV